MLVYATADQLETWMGEPPEPAPAKLTAMLREASGLVGTACQCDIYDTLPNGKPSDDDLSEAMQEATCAQVHAWLASGDDPIKGAGGQEPRLTTTAIDGASLSYDTYLTAPDRMNALKFLAPGALRILRLAGLASSAVQSW